MAASKLSKDLEGMRQAGLLWAINRYVFHPRGFAIAFEYDSITGREPTGLKMIGDGQEPWQFDSSDDDDGFIRFEEWLDSLRDNTEKVDQNATTV